MLKNLVVSQKMINFAPENNNKQITDMKRTLKELDRELEQYFKGIDQRINKSVYKLSVTHPIDGAVACIRLIHYDGEVCDSVRVYSKTTNGGCFGVAIPTSDLPLKEQVYIMNQVFDTPAKAYEFAVVRAKEINNFFKH